MVQLSKRDQEQMEKAKDFMAPTAGAGDTPSLMRSMFFGRLPLSTILPYPSPDPAEAAQVDRLIADVDTFMDEHVDPDLIDAEERIPQHVIDGLGALGVMGMTVPKDYGGLGLSHTGYCRVLERIGQRCASTAVLVGAHQSIGLKAIVLNGTDEQKRRYLPDLAAGRTIAAFALTEPGAGSDAANVQTTAIPSADGSHFVINGEKKYITNGALAGVMTVLARTPVEVDGAIKHKVTAFIVTPDTPGFEVVKPNRPKMGIRGTWQAVLKFTDMKVPAESILGELGRGLRVALTVLDYGRCTLSAGCVGGAKIALGMAITHAKEREQFGRKLADFELIQAKLARMAELTYAMDAMTYLCAGLVDRHEHDIMLETAATKLFCSEASWRVVDDAIQVFGGEGYMRSTGLERMMRDSRINRIVEGATEVMTSFVALMGMKGVGEEFEQVLKALRHPVAKWGTLSGFFGHAVSDILIGPSVKGLHAELTREGKQLAKLTRSLARGVTRLLAWHQTKVLDRQMLQQRVAWTAIEMFAIAAVISKLNTQLQLCAASGQAKPDAALARDLVIGKAYCCHAAARCDQRLRGLIRNHDKARKQVANAVLNDA
jgi:alkylation response protein AidB-like acyl-CoA dehydrogenase